MAAIMNIFSLVMGNVLLCFTDINHDFRAMKTMNGIIILLMVYQQPILANDLSKIRFIKSFMENEQKPTVLVFDNLCWGKKFEVELVRKLSRAGFRSTSMRSDFEHQIHRDLFFLDLACPQSEEMIANATSRSLFGYGYRWLILSDFDQSRQSAIWDSPILSDSDVVLAERIEDGYKMTEMHKPSNVSSMVMSPRGYYNGSLVDVRPHRQLYRRRRDVMGSPITMSNVIQDSNTTQYHLLKESRLELQFDVAAKVSWTTVKMAFNMLNATPRSIFSHRWGYKLKGQWSGMINDLHVNNADLGTNCLVETERMDVATYSDVLASIKVRFIFRQPPLSYTTNIFSLPFSSYVWLAIAVCAAVSTLSLYLSSKVELKYGTSQTQLDGRIGDALLVVLSAISQQGCVLEPKKSSGRIMLWIFFTALMALYAAYSANIVVLLQAPSSSIRTLAQLASSKITVAANDVDYNHFLLSRYQDPIRVAIYKRIDPGKGKGQFLDVNEGVEKIRQGLFAFHSIVEPVYRRIEQTFLESEKCDLVEMDYLNRFDAFTPIRKQSPYVELLKVAFKQIREAGLNSAVNLRLQTPKPRCSSKQSAFSSVGMLDLRPVLLLMVYGTALSIAILLMEIAVSKIRVKL